MLPQDWGSKRKGGPLGMAVILWPNAVRLPLPSMYAGKRKTKKQRWS